MHLLIFDHLNLNCLSHLRYGSVCNNLVFTISYPNSPLHRVNSCELNICVYGTHKCVCFSSCFQDICTKLSEYVNAHICREPPNKAIRVLAKSNKTGVGTSYSFILQEQSYQNWQSKRKKLMHPISKYLKNGLIYSDW